MKKFTSVILVAVIAVLLTLGVLGGILAVEADAAQERLFEICESSNKHYHDVFTIVDNDTGVNYIAIASYHKAISITPRLNADGSLYVSK